MSAYEAGGSTIFILTWHAMVDNSPPPSFILPRCLGVTALFRGLTSVIANSDDAKTT